MPSWADDEERRMAEWFDDAPPRRAPRRPLVSRTWPDHWPTGTCPICGEDHVLCEDGLCPDCHAVMNGDLEELPDDD